MSNLTVGDWEVKIEELPYNRDKRIYLVQRTNAGMNLITKEGVSLYVKEGELPNPDKCYFAIMSDEQLQAFADALSLKGVKTSNDHKNEGLLVAQAAHLEDMRRLVFNDNQITYNTRDIKLED